MSETNELMLVDLSAVYWAAWHSSANDQVSAAHDRAVGHVRRLVNGYELVAICCDSGVSFRKELDPQYKANRPEKDAAAVAELHRAMETLRKDGLLLWSVKGFEADDIIATATQAAEAHGHAVVIATADKDLLQLVGERVRVLSTMTHTRLGPDEVKAKLGVPPEQVRDWLALVGDKSDNIAGVPKVGAKTAASLLEKLGDIDGIQTALRDDPESVSTPAIVKSLQEHGDALELARRLVTLRYDVPIDFQEIYQERKPEQLIEQENENMDAKDSELDSDTVEVKPEQIESPAAEKTPAPTAMVVASPVPFEHGLEPATLGTAHKMAIGLFNSRLYQRYQNAEAIWAVIIRGREMGLGAMTALDAFHVIEGKPAPHAMLIIARAKQHPDCEYFQCIETTATSATWETKNRNNPKPTKLTYTLEQAANAGLKGGNWTKRPDEMIRKTAGVQLARIEYPDAAMGLYAWEELDGDAS